VFQTHTDMQTTLRSLICSSMINSVVLDCLPAASPISKWKVLSNQRRSQPSVALPLTQVTDGRPHFDALDWGGGLLGAVVVSDYNSLWNDNFMRGCRRRLWNDSSSCVERTWNSGNALSAAFNTKLQI